MIPKMAAATAMACLAVLVVLAAAAAAAMPAADAQSSAPQRPTGLAATSTSSTVTLTWDNPGDSSITGYKILSRATATQSILTVLVSNTGSAATSYIVTGLAPDTTYQFALMATNGAGSSVPSKIITVSTKAPGQPAPPPTTTAPPPAPPPTTTPTPTSPPAPPPPPTTTPPGAAGLATAITGLSNIVYELTQKITALEAEIAQLRGALSGQGGPPPVDAGNFVPVYYAATDPFNQAQKKWYEDQDFLEGFTERLNRTLVLPYNVYVTMQECGEVNAYYSPDTKTIVICYEYVTDLEFLLDPYYATNAELFLHVDAVVTFVTLHELGHALVDVYDLPITGPEEDAVDQFATIIALEYIPYEQSRSILSATLNSWEALGRSDSIFPTKEQLAGVHSLGHQRFYNMACWMYGSNAHGYSWLVDRGILPDNRAVYCQPEYERASDSWYRLVSPFLASPGLVPAP